MLIKLHGTRGSIPQPADTSKYGGNTSCCEVLTDDMQIILDTGTGFQNVQLDTNRTSIILYSIRFLSAFIEFTEPLLITHYLERCNRSTDLVSLL